MIPKYNLNLNLNLNLPRSLYFLQRWQHNHCKKETRGKHLLVMTSTSAIPTSDQEYSSLYEKVSLKNNAKRAAEIFILVLLLSLVLYRAVTFRNHHGVVWMLAMACESWFAFIWFLTLSTKWNPVTYKTYPQRLLRRVRSVPRIDMFVTTADAEMEPPIITVNTVLSLLAVDYPAEKIACYVSDDGCSPLTYYSLKEASKFAKLWVPFCKKHDIQTRAPFRYFAADEHNSKVESSSTEFQRAYRTIKEEYEKLCEKIEVARQKTIPCDLTGDIAEFSDAESRNHPTIIKIINENEDGDSEGVPHLIYISREKRPKHHHHYKAGAMNVLARVSGILTNAPFMLNVDCDMYANNPRIVLHALCLLLGAKSETESGFAQSPQMFYNGLKDDPFGNQLEVLLEFLGRGIAGIQGPFYQGTGCFHRRKVIYGALPKDSLDVEDLKLNGKDPGVTVEDLLKGFGSSKELIRSASYALEGKLESDSPRCLSSSLEAAHEVASCTYEFDTDWGNKIGLLYGSTAEDILTGLNIHRKGWRTTYCTPDPPAFLGCVPNGGPAAMTQMKRWATGLLEILVGKNSPVCATLFGKLQFRMCLAYLWVLLWAVRSIPEIVYELLPAYCIITNTHFLPKVDDPIMAIPVLLFLTYYLFTLFEYFQVGLSVRAWWNNQRMLRVTSACAWSFGVLGVVLKLLGISQTVFEVTKKENSAPGGGDTIPAGKFTFDKSPMFVPGTTLVLVELMALVMMVLGLRPQAQGSGGSGVGEVLCAVCVLLCFSVFVRGLFEKRGIPLPTVIKSAAFATLFVHLSIFTSRA